MKKLKLKGWLLIDDWKKPVGIYLKKREGCKHEIGYHSIGGFPGHEHTHTTGEQYCFNCNKTLTEIISHAISQAVNKFIASERKKLEMLNFYGVSKVQYDMIVEAERERVREYAEQLIQTERYAGAPYAINKLLDFLKGK
jgi:hypothetical protein